MLRFVIIAAVISLPVPGSASEPRERQPWAEFSKDPARGLAQVAISLGTFEGQRGAPPIYWAERVGGSEGGHTDSVECPALLSVIERMSAIAMLDMTAPTGQVSIGDGTSYRFYSRSTNLDSITLTSSGGALGQWIEQTLITLEDCWSSS